MEKPGYLSLTQVFAAVGKAFHISVLLSLKWVQSYLPCLHPNVVVRLQ